MAQADTMPQQTAPELSAFQRDLLYVIASVEPAKGTKIGDEMKGYYDQSMNPGRLYPNLDTLVDMGLVTKGERDARTNEYSLTSRAESLLAQRREWERERFEGVSA